MKSREELEKIAREILESIPAADYDTDPDAHEIVTDALTRVQDEAMNSVLPLDELNYLISELEDHGRPDTARLGGFHTAGEAFCSLANQAKRLRANMKPAPQLPSDEQIEQASQSFGLKYTGELAFIEGAHWLRAHAKPAENDNAFLARMNKKPPP